MSAQIGRLAHSRGASYEVTAGAMDVVSGRAAVVRETLARFGDLSVAAYLRSAFPTVRDAWQPRADLIGAMSDEARALLGDAVAERLSSDLTAFPAVLTANHHGADFFAQSVQGSLLFASRGVGAGRRSTVPVLACGTVPLDNLTYPMGMLLYDAGEGSADALPLRVPIFPNRVRREMVSVAGPLDRDMVSRARGRLQALADRHQLAREVETSARRMLDGIYATPEVLDLTSYSEQAVLINARLWKQLYAAPEHAPDLVYLEFERVASRLLTADLADSSSLAMSTLADDSVRLQILNRLDGIRACWNIGQLERRLHTRPGERPDPTTAGAGTFLLWGIDGAGRRVPLCPSRSDRGTGRLEGVDDRGGRWSYELEPERLREHLEARRLLPSLFTSFLVCSLARGVTCAGGYYQAEYLPAMQRALVAALRAVGAPDVMVARVGRVPTASYLAGMQCVLHDLPGGGLLPAGIAEIAAAGGLADSDLEQILSMTVRDAHLASLAETWPDVAGDTRPQGSWKEQLAAECGAMFSGRMVVK